MRATNHLNALRAFEAAARHRSFVAAAQELYVTPAAVGQLVRSLESSLNVSLFHRAPSGPSRLELTDEARAVLPDVQAGLERLSMALQRLRVGSIGESIKVTLPPAFADKWLLPRLERFQSRHPEVELRLDTSGKLVDFKSERVDVGIRYGAGKWRGMQSTYLLKDEFFPVCSPALLSGEHPLQSPSDLRHHALIHDVSMEAEDSFPTWKSWLSSAGLANLESQRGIRINDSAAVLQAAINGTGVALGRTSLVASDLAAGRLVRPFGPSQTSDFSYYIVRRVGSPSSQAIDAFARWLHEEVASEAHTTLKPFES
jgi:LysR family transcriptional regulator, glycine cleavage system transcriptional activator